MISSIVFKYFSALMVTLWFLGFRSVAICLFLSSRAAAWLRLLVAVSLGLGCLFVLGGAKKSDLTNEVSGLAPPKPTLILGTEGTYAPWNYLDNQGLPEGFDVAVAQNIACRLHKKLVVKLAPFMNLINNLHTGQYDFIAASVSVTPERKAKVAFTVPYAVTKVVFLGLKKNFERCIPKRKGTLSPQDMDKVNTRYLASLLKGCIVGTQSGTTWPNFLKTTFGYNLSIRYYASQSQLMLDLSLGRVDLALVGVSVVGPYLKRLPHLVQVGRPFSSAFHPALGQGISVAVAQKGPLLQAINQAIINMAYDGTLKALSLKYFGADLSAEVKG